MAGAGLKISTDDAEFERAMGGMLDRLTNLEPLMKIVGAIMVASVQRNFEEGGRPGWAPHSETTRKRRGEGARVLVDQGFAGGMLGSISAQADERSVTIGTNKIQGAVQQKGAKRGAFGTTMRGAPIPWGDIPARPFLMVQSEDYAEMAAAVGEYLTGGSQ